ncbi:nascent polypeptide-associated complex subunit alpha, muscle-specific form-like isoform X2 [Uranotaenia lowii]|uniref:nascent polypeptide-associated complex subunit alpha, muscle-specific form-like isoform X2 n=1 Tax=Uranotaenia lowii TaxID=190385 RepID=UPI00247A4C62|nr:nascent polypeptide-associated complex subunit alpha, muscle-specific form-like isoform X2 [Uranotaenia lowii]
MKIGVLVLVFLIVCVHHESWGQQKPTIKTTTKAAASHKGTSPKPTPAQSGKLVATTAKRGPVTTKKAVASGKSGKLVATTPKKGPVPTKKTVSSDRSGKLVATTPKKGPGVTTKKSTAASGKSGKIVATTPKKAPAVATTKKTTAPKGSGKHVATTTKKRPVAPVVIENKSGNLKAPTTKAPKNQPMKMSTTKKGATTAKGFKIQPIPRKETSDNSPIISPFASVFSLPPGMLASPIFPGVAYTAIPYKLDPPPASNSSGNATESSTPGSPANELPASSNSSSVPTIDTLFNSTDTDYDSVPIASPNVGLSEDGNDTLEPQESEETEASTPPQLGEREGEIQPNAETISTTTVKQRIRMRRRKTTPATPFRRRFKRRKTTIPANEATETTTEQSSGS